MTVTKARAFANAFKTTIPVLMGYIPLGMAFGLLLATQTGFGADVAAIMSLLMYGGSSQFLAVEMFANGAGLFEMFLMTLFLSARHMVYGLSLTETFSGNPYKPYLIFALTDEAYALHVSSKSPDPALEPFWRLCVSALCHSYWIAGGVLGALLGGVITLNLEGLDFVLTALFVVLATDMYMKRKSAPPFAVGALCGAAALLIPNRMFMMPAAIAGILAALLLLRGRLERGERDGGGA